MNPTISLIGNLMKRPSVLAITGIGIIIFALFGLPILLTMPHILIMAGLIVIGIGFLISPFLTSRPLWKLVISLLFFVSAISVFVKPEWFGLVVG